MWTHYLRQVAKIDDFFSLSNTVRNVSAKDKAQTADYLEPIKAFARSTYQSIYIIDYETKGFEYVSDNPLFLCGHTAQEVKEMGYAFYLKYVTKEDLDLLLKINAVGFEFYEKVPIAERKDYTIAYDFHLKNQEGKTILINQKLTPLFLTEKGKLWKAICFVSLSTEQDSGNITVYNKKDGATLKYNLKRNFWESTEKIKLAKREQEIIELSTRGFTINEIAEAIFISPDTVKFHRRKLFEKLDVSTISEAIAFVTNNKLL